MTVSASFSEFLSNIKVNNYDVIGMRYREITKKLNKTFRDTDSDLNAKCAKNRQKCTEMRVCLYISWNV